MIKVDGLSRTYDQFIAVNDVSFSIQSGEIVGLLGHNGAGTTTVMKMLTGYLEPTNGNVEIEGKSIDDDCLSIQQKIGYLPENCPTYPEMTVIDYLEYIARMRGVNDENIVDAIRNAIDNTKLAEKANQLINTLSRGYRQRVGVAQAIIHQPEILILDEPTNGLDPSQILQMRQLIKDLSAKTTVIISTHILQEVKAICDRVIIMKNGEIGLDSAIKDIQQIERLMLSINCSQEETKALLSDFDFIESIDPIQQQAGSHTFRLQLVQKTELTSNELSSKIAQRVIEKGHDLYAIFPEQRDLETVFAEINRVGS